MAVKGNQFKANTFKEPEGNESSNQRQTEEKPKVKLTVPKINFSGSRATRILGSFIILLTFFLTGAFISYLFSWQEDQSYISDANGGWRNIGKTVEELEQAGVKHPMVDNWMGKIGALTANEFIYNWFGIAAFLICPLLFVIGYKLLFRRTLFPLVKGVNYTVFLLLFISLFIGFAHSFFAEAPHYLEGGFGYWSNAFLASQIGSLGVAALLIFILLTALIIIYNFDLKFTGTLPRVAGLGFGKSNTPDTHKQDGKPTGNVQRFDAHAEGDSPEDDDNSLPDDHEGNASDNLEFEVINTLTAPDTLPVQHHLDGEPVPAPENNTEIQLKPVHKEPEFEVVQPQAEDDAADALVKEFGAYDPTLDLSDYKYPRLDLLEEHANNKVMVSQQELEDNKNKIKETLNHYNIDIAKISATIGPTVTLYEIIPAPGVRISKIKNLEDDIALSLAALGIRIIAPMPGKGTIGIEVPNQHPEMVSMRSVIASDKYRNSNMDLPIALGKTISNEVFIADLAKMPHLLVAGATGQGKSVGINAILVSLLYKKHPSQLKFVLVDPKKVELTLFNKIERHFLAKLPGEEDAIITDTKKVINTLNSLCIEMDQRYDLLKDAQVRNLKEYNTKFIGRRLKPEKGHRFLPYIVLVIDEFADLMMTAGKEVETPIARLAQLARAIGIHLVLATQRPSVNIITGTIKANFPARLAFRVGAKVDSRTILDTGGADQLIGRGDMLLLNGSDLIRLQCPFVDTPEVDAVSEFIGAQRGYTDAYQLPEYVGADGEGSVKDIDLSDRDQFFEEAARLIVMSQQGSTSLLQRKLKVGYNKAGRIIDQLEAAGVVGPFSGSKAREVLIPDEYALEQLLNNLK